MNICLPVEQADGFNSRIFPDLRNAPALLIVDSESGQISGIDTSTGVCGAIPADIDTLIFVEGIGRGMFNGLQRQGIRVFSTQAETVGEALVQLATGELEEVSEVQCTGHSHRPKQSQCGCSGHGDNHGGCSCH